MIIDSDCVRIRADRSTTCPPTAVLAKDSLRVVRSREKEAGPDIWPSSAADLRELRWAPDGAVFTMTT